MLLSFINLCRSDTNLFYRCNRVQNLCRSDTAEREDHRHVKVVSSAQESEGGVIDPKDNEQGQELFVVIGSL